MTISYSFVHYYSSTFLLFFGSITSYYYSISENLSVAAYYWQELEVLAAAMLVWCFGWSLSREGWNRKYIYWRAVWIGYDERWC